MNWSDIQFRPDNTFLRQFGFLCCGMFAFLAIWQALFSGNALLAILFGVFAGVVGIVSVFAPSLLRHVYVSWMVIVFPIGWTVSRIMLGLLFFGVLTPVALFFRLIGRDALHRKQEPEQETYWTTRDQTNDVKRYFRQY